MISRLHYISQEINGKSHIENITEACKAGVDWVQLRILDKPKDEIADIAAQAKVICKKYGASLIITDHVEIAKSIKANGVHLESTEISPIEARKMLGDRPYIGGTANSWEDVLKLHMAGVDYIGLGPLKKSPTKQHSSPELGIKGFSTVMNNMIINDMDTPIIAVGGIELEDIFDLQMTGVHGIAVASLINQSEEKSTTVEEINQLMLNGEVMPEDDMDDDFDDDDDDPFGEFEDEMDYGKEY